MALLIRRSRNGRRRIVFFPIALVCLAVLGLSAARGTAQTVPTTEYQVKAAFLYNFAKFVEWPRRADRSLERTLVVGVLGRDPFGDALDALKGMEVRGRRVEVKRISRLEDARGCQILFISASERGRMAHILRYLHDLPVLTVADTDGFCRAGGMINLVHVGDKIGFEINAAAAKRAGIIISSRLLRLARTVIE